MTITGALTFETWQDTKLPPSEVREHHRTIQRFENFWRGVRAAWEPFLDMMVRFWEAFKDTLHHIHEVMQPIIVAFTEVGETWPVRPASH